MQGSTNIRIAVPASLDIKQDPISKITNPKKGWEYGSNSTAPA
jgi:hypothetical protein